MRIVQLLPELNEGGVERGTVELSREMVKLGHDSIVISRGGKLQSRIEEEGGRHIALDVCGKNPLTVFSRMVKLRRVLKEVCPDVIHARSRVPAWLAFLANRTLHIPFVTTVHGFNSVSPYSKIMTMSDHVICVSGAVKNYIQKYYQVPDFKITVIPRGIDLQTFNPETIDHRFMEEFSKQYGLGEKFVVTTVGRITQLKDLETLIRSIALLKERIPNVLALIVGGVREDKEGYFEMLKALIEELQLEERILFTGSQTKVAEIYALSNVVVSASKKPESFGRTVAEAIAMNTPVIATNHGGVVDIVQDGKNGFLVEIGNVEALVSAIMNVRTLRFDGYRYVSERFSLDQMVGSTLGVYERVIKTLTK